MRRGGSLNMWGEDTILSSIAERGNSWIRYYVSFLALLGMTKIKMDSLIFPIYSTFPLSGNT